MLRQLRIEYPGAIYHLMNRGDRREPIFVDDFDRQRFVTTLGEVGIKSGWQVHAYGLMRNHFQLVVELKKIRRVWCLGSETFRQELLAQAHQRTGDSRVTQWETEAKEPDEFNLE